MSEVSGFPVPQLDPRVLEVYRGVREVLSKYRSGKLPKAFKIIPALSNWEQILAGDAVRAGTREKRRGRGTGDEEEEYVGPRLTRQILQQARQQQIGRAHV